MTKGQTIYIAPFTDKFMQGFSEGRVVKTGRKWLYLEWSHNPKIICKFLLINQNKTWSVHKW